MITEIAIIILLIIINGIFVLSEIALISSRKARLQQRANEGDEGARKALELASSPNRFLSTCQIGVTFISILAGAFGGSTVAGEVEARLKEIPLLTPYSHIAGIILVVMGISYFSLVVGELVPKRLGMSRPEKVASIIASPMNTISLLLSPVVRILSISTDLVLKVAGIKPVEEPPVTEEEIKILIDEGTRAGVFEEVEQDIVERVFRLSDRRAASLMIPRADVIWLDIDDSPDEIRLKVEASDYPLFPVGRGSLDDVLGVVRARDMLSCSLKDQQIDLKSSLMPPQFIPESMAALKILELFRQSGVQVALVVDEYGGIQGLVTLKDILEAIVGDMPYVGKPTEPQVVKRDDGSWLVDGMLSTDEFKEIFQVKRLPGEDSGYYQTIGGFVMMHLGRIPSTGDRFVWDDLSFEVVDMDENRIDKMIIKPGVGSNG
ncbi:MAG: hemolysin family protein [Methanotrichaceae archaeon]|jgi:putative hemolysin